MIPFNLPSVIIRVATYDQRKGELGLVMEWRD
jgi:hypothetical protein